MFVEDFEDKFLCYELEPITVWGLGNSRTEAMKDAIYTIDRSLTIPLSLITIQCSHKLYEMIGKKGGAFDKWEISSDGKAVVKEA